MTDIQKIQRTIDYSHLWKTFLISLIAAFFASMVIYFFTNYVVLYFAYDFDIPAYFDISGTHFTDNANPHDWSRDALITILLSKPISAFILGIILLILLMAGNNKPIVVILMLFWVNIFSFKEAFGILIDDAIAGSGTYEVALVMNIGTMVIIITSLILIYILYQVGMMNSRLIIMSFQNQNLLNTKNRLVFFTTIFIIPWLLILLFTYFETSGSLPTSQVYKNLPILFLLLPFLTAGKIKNKSFVYSKCDYHKPIDLILTIVLAILTIVLIFLMDNGIQIIGN